MLKFYCLLFVRGTYLLYRLKNYKTNPCQILFCFYVNKTNGDCVQEVKGKAINLVTLLYFKGYLIVLCFIHWSVQY